MAQTVNLSALPSMVRIHPSPPFESFWMWNDWCFNNLSRKTWFWICCENVLERSQSTAFHVESLDGNKIAKIEITENAPKIFDDLKILKIHNQKDFDKIKKNLLRWCKSERNGVKIWQYAKLVWEDNHPNENVKFE